MRIPSVAKQVLKSQSTRCQHDVVTEGPSSRKLGFISLFFPIYFSWSLVSSTPKPTWLGWHDKRLFSVSLYPTSQTSAKAEQSPQNVNYLVKNGLSPKFSNYSPKMKLLDGSIPMLIIIYHIITLCPSENNLCIHCDIHTWNISSSMCSILLHTSLKPTKIHQRC